MQMFLEEQGVEVWKSIKSDPFIPTTIINSASQPKPKEEWNEEDNEKFLHDKKGENFILST